MNFREFIELEESRFGDFIQGGIKGAAMGTALLGSSFAQKPIVAAPINPTTAPSVQAQIPATTRPATAPTNSLDYIAKYISRNEGGPRLQVYDDGIGKPTIGVGHYLQPDSRQIFQKLFGDTVNFDSILNGSQSLTESQADTLFKYDLGRHINRAKQIVPALDTFPPYLQAALVDAVYRGDLGPATAKLINQGKFDLAATEYLNHKQYQNRKALGIPGIGPRMERNRDALIRYHNEINRGTMRQ